MHGSVLICIAVDSTFMVVRFRLYEDKESIFHHRIFADGKIAFHVFDWRFFFDPVGDGLNAGERSTNTIFATPQAQCLVLWRAELETGLKKL